MTLKLKDQFSYLLPGYVLIFGINGNIKFANQQFETEFEGINNIYNAHDKGFKDNLNYSVQELINSKSNNGNIVTYLKHKTKDSGIWIKWNLKFDRNSKSVFANGQDFSEDYNFQEIMKDAQSAAEIGIWEYDIEKNKTIWSEVVYDIHEIEDRSQFNLEDAVDFYHPDSKDLIENAVQEAIIHNKPWDLICQLNTAKGNTIWVRARGRKKINDGKTERLIGTFQKIDANKRLELSLQKAEENLAQIIKYTPAAVAMFDLNMCYIAHSDRWLEDYKLKDQHLIGRSHYEIFPDVLDRWKEDHKRVMNGETLINREDEWKRKDGSTVYINWELRPWKDSNGEIGGLIMYTQVITDQVKNRKHLESLIDELNRSNSDLEQFAYVASHDMKEPVRMINSFSDLLRLKYADQLDEKGKTYLSKIKNSSERMTKMISSLLDYARIGQNSERQTTFLFSKSLNNVLEDQSKFLSERNAKVSLNSSDHEIYYNPNFLRIILTNLIINGVKYNKNVNPEISIDLEKQENDLIVKVRDNGIGIEKGNEAKVFGIFQRLQNSSDYAGTGIGLALVKKIIESGGGNITYESDGKNGTIFIFKLRSVKKE